MQNSTIAHKTVNYLFLSRQQFSHIPLEHGRISTDSSKRYYSLNENNIMKYAYRTTQISASQLLPSFLRQIQDGITRHLWRVLQTGQQASTFKRSSTSKISPACVFLGIASAGFVVIAPGCTQYANGPLSAFSSSKISVCLSPANFDAPFALAFGRKL